MDMSGEVLVTTAGTPAALGSGPLNGPLAIKALHTNTGLAYVCGAGLDGSAGYHLNKDESVRLNFVGNLASVLIDVAVDGEGIRWIALNQ